MAIKDVLITLGLTVACLLVSTVNAQLTTAEQQATLRFLREFVDEYEDVLRPLWTGDNYCAWSGVTCDANDDVHVDLSGRGLRGDLPEPKKKEGGLVRVVSIDLSNNRGLRQFESDWQYLTNLRRINLSYTSLKGYIPDQWRSMSSLEELHAHHTALCRNLPDWSAATMPNLRAVDLSYNNFHGSIRGDWASFRKLEQFDISGNQFCGCAPASWSSAPVLSAAAALTPLGSASCASNSCSNSQYCPDTPNEGGEIPITSSSNDGTGSTDRYTLNFLREFVDEYKDVLRPLWTGDNYCAWSGVTCDANGDVHVDLSGRGLSGDLPDPEKSEARFVRVVSIDLSNNRGLRQFESDWQYLTNLRRINLSYTSLKGYIPDQWRSMSGLEELYVHHTAACRNLPDWSAATMPNLRAVDLSYNNFYGSIRGDWASFRKLEQFDISGNQFCGCAPASWSSAPVLSAAAALTPLGSASCASNSCSNSQYCPDTPNEGGEIPITSSSNDGTGSTDRYTLNFLREFVDEYKDVLRPLWTGDNYCAWSGVTCDANGDVHVDLSGRGLSGDLPDPEKSEARFVRVVSIDLSNNRGLRQFESDWQYLTNLRRINLSYTSLKGYIPDQWRSMSGLEELYVHHTAACRNLPDWSAATMPNLRAVDLSYNNFYGSIRGDWASFRKLEQFDISGNQFCGCAPASWSSAPVLSAAAALTPLGSASCASNSCSNSQYCPDTPNEGGEIPITSSSNDGTGSTDRYTLNFLREFVDEYKDVLRPLWTGDNYCAWSGVTCDANGDVHVDLSGRGLSGDLPDPEKSEARFVRVVSIDLSNNRGLRQFESDWQYLTNLRRINLSYTSLKGYIPDQWRSMSGLEELYVHHTAACRNLPDWSAATMPNLRAVDLSYNNFYGSIRGDWASFRKLEQFDISGNQFCGCAPASWSSAPVLSAAAALTPLGSASCASNSCSNSQYCPDTPNEGGEIPITSSSNDGTGSTDRYTLNFLREFVDEYKDVLRPLWTGDNYCAWSGVTCDANGDVHVDLSGRGLSGDLPDPEKSEARFVRVVSIDLSNNRGLRQFESDWQYLTNLRRINLSYTSLKGYIPDQWRSMSGLEELYVHHTAACRNLPDWSAATMPNLRAVDLSYNNFHGSIRGDWASFRKLEQFDISGNQFCGCAPASWSSAPVLSAAAALTPLGSASCASNSCSNSQYCPDTPNEGGEIPITSSSNDGTGSTDRYTLNFLREFVDEYKDVLRPLWTGDNYCAWSGVTCDANGDVHVDLSGRGLSGDLPDPEKSEARFVRVVSIDLSNNRGLRQFESDWQYLTNLRRINLSYTSLKGYIPDQWRSMSGLEELYVHHTAACRNLPDWSAATMPNLRAVDLSYNNFYGSIRGDWASFRKLEQFDISGNQFCGCAPASWSSAPVLSAAAALTPLGSASCASNSCSNSQYCPDTPNEGGEIPITSSSNDGTGSTDRYTLNFLREFVDEYKDVLRPLWTGDNYCAWSGVTCDANGDVHVDLSGRGLSGDLPDPEKSEARFVRVVSIDLSNNRGLRQFESDWQYLTNLRRINLSYTSLKGYIPDQWRSMSGLEELYVHHTAACRNLPDWSAATMPNLRAVDLSYNNFHGSIRGDWASFRKLEQFDISGNQFCGCAPASWSSAPVLSAAAALTPLGSASCASNSCSNSQYCPDTPNEGGEIPITSSSNDGTGSTDRYTLNFLREFVDEYKDVLRPLWTGDNYCAWSGVTCDANGDVHVDLSGRGLSGDLPDPEKSEARFVRVVSIDLSNNRGLRQFESDWQYLTNLRRINLSYTSLKGYIPDQWRSMSGLEELYVHHTAACRNLPDWSAATMPNLRAVDLSYNNFYGSIRGDWASFRKLEQFDISGNQFCGCAPASWSSAPVLSAAAALTPLGSASCASNSCSNSQYCPDTPNEGGEIPITSSSNDGTGSTDRYTLNFLREFVDEYKDVLRPLWTGDNYCAWSGVTCDANGDVHVDLSGRGLSGDLPDPEKSEARFVRVVSIDLSNNRGLRQFESDWQYLTNLRRINLSYTSLKGYIPDQWRSMSGLEELYVHHTAACRNLPDWSAATMPNLRAVDLSYNNFHGSIRGDWASFRKLEQFDISGNQFCGCAPASWSSAPVLSAAAALTPLGSASCASNSCSNSQYCPDTPNEGGEIPITSSSNDGTGSTDRYTLNFLREFVDEYKDVLRPLWTGDNYCAWSGVTCDANGDVHVDLSGRGLVGNLPLPAAWEGEMVRVVSINLSNNVGITGFFPDSWKYLTLLRLVNLSYTSLQGALPDAWNGMSSIEEVYITNTRACLGLPNWAMRTLRRVDLSNNNLKGALAYSWVNMVSLESANLAGNSFCACMPVNWIGRPALEAAVDTASNADVLRSPTCGFANRCTYLSFICY